MENVDLSAFSQVRIITIPRLSGLPEVDTVMFNRDVIREKSNEMTEPGQKMIIMVWDELTEGRPWKLLETKEFYEYVKSLTSK